MAKPQLRKSAAVAPRRPTPTSKPAAAASKATPTARRLSLRPRLPTVATNRLGGRTAGFVSWVRDIQLEMHKVAWPSREQATKLTSLVIAISVLVGIFLGAVDAVFAKMIELFLQ